jgi:hypothetical protein
MDTLLDLDKPETRSDGGLSRSVPAMRGGEATTIWKAKHYYQA